MRRLLALKRTYPAESFLKAIEIHGRMNLFIHLSQGAEFPQLLLDELRIVHRIQGVCGQLSPLRSRGVERETRDCFLMHSTTILSALSRSSDERSGIDTPVENPYTTSKVTSTTGLRKAIIETLWT